MITIQQAYDQFAATRHSPEYAEKQIHPFPPAEVVSRETFLLQKVDGKIVLDVGASGPMSEAIQKVAKKWYGIDRPNIQKGFDRYVGYSAILTGPTGPDHSIFFIDLDLEPERMPAFSDVEVVVCGEVLEHLSNPGRFLGFLRCRTSPQTQLIATVPNAFSSQSQKYVKKGIENCNRDHVAWHSPRTIRTLLERVGYEPKEWAWYNGRPGTAEGIIVVAE